MGKKRVAGLIFTLLIVFSSIYVSAFTFQKTTITDVIAKELSAPAKFNMYISTGGTDYFSFYTYADVKLSPIGTEKIEAPGKTITLEVYPTAKLLDERKGAYTFVYYIKSEYQDTKEEQLTIKILPLSEILKIQLPEEINIDSAIIPVTIENTANINLEKISLSVESPFLTAKEDFSLAALEKKEITGFIDKDKIAKLTAGKYILTFIFNVNNEATVKVEKSVTLSEKSNIMTTEEEKGNIFYPILKITKKNAGNVVSIAEVIVKKNAFSRAFTSFTPAPDKIERSGAGYVYIWYRQLKPQETLQVEVKTNYLMPFGIILAVLIIASLITIFLRTKLILKKKVVQVRTKGDEFAFKVILIVKARDNIENVIVRDRLPGLAELHERYGTISPTKVDKRALEWHFDVMQKGEERAFSYIAYSKVSVLGKFEIPRANVAYKHKGKTKFGMSNAVFLLTEERHHTHEAHPRLVSNQPKK